MQVPRISFGRNLVSADELRALLARRRSDSFVSGLVSGCLAGGAIVYFFDLASGRRRRHLVFDKLRHLERCVVAGLGRGGRDLAHRTRGIVSETRHRLRREDSTDEVIEERVRSKMGRVVSHPNGIEVTVTDGYVLLTGPILADEVEALLKVVRHVRGVCAVENRLAAHATPGDVPALQGETRRRGARFELLQENWSPAARLLVGAAGGSFVASGVLRGHPLLSLVGGLLLARAGANRPYRRLFGIGAGRRAIDFQKTLQINAPIEAVFGYFRQLQNFPLFMSHL